MVHICRGGAAAGRGVFPTFTATEQAVGQPLYSRQEAHTGGGGGVAGSAAARPPGWPPCRSCWPGSAGRRASLQEGRFSASQQRRQESLLSWLAQWRPYWLLEAQRLTQMLCQPGCPSVCALCSAQSSACTTPAAGATGATAAGLHMAAGSCGSPVLVARGPCRMVGVTATATEKPMEGKCNKLGRKFALRVQQAWRQHLYCLHLLATCNQPSQASLFK